MIEQRLNVDAVLCPIHGLALIPKEVVGEGILYEFVKRDDRDYLRYRLREGDAERSPEALYMKIQFFVTGLTVTSLAHFWIDDVLLDEQFNVIWERPKVVPLVIDKEVDKEGPLTLAVRELLKAADITGWIAQRYPRVFTYHRIGLFLLRSSLPTEYFYADVLLNFWKIVELIVRDRTHRKPELASILRECAKLQVTAADRDEIKEFYIIRGRDSAHGFAGAQDVSREKAVECKLLAEELILYDYVDRTKALTASYSVTVHETAERAVVREKGQRR